jgi:hypothetical protein
MVPLYKEHNLLEKIATILEQYPHNGLMCAHEIAMEIKARYPETFAAINKPVGGDGSGQDTLTRYIGNLLFPTSERPIPEVAERFDAYVFGRVGVSSIAFKDGSTQGMNPSYEMALFSLRRA